MYYIPNRAAAGPRGVGNPARSRFLGGVFLQWPQAGDRVRQTDYRRKMLILRMVTLHAVGSRNSLTIS